MKFKSEIITAASGSIGGATYLHGKSGLQRQAKPRPSNTSSPGQRAARAEFSELANAWSQTLTQEQRDSWSNFAALTPMTGTFGDQLTLSGSQMFLRCNAPRRQAGLARVLTGPTTPGLSTFSIEFAIVDVSLGIIVVQYKNDDPWNTETGAFLTISTTRFLPFARNRTTGKKRTLVSILGDPGGTPGNVVSTTNAFEQLASQSTPGLKINFSFLGGRADGRISAQQQAFVTVQS